MSLRQRHLIQLGAAVLLAATILGVFALVAWSDQPRVRYASLKCVYRQIYNYKGPVDVVVVGTSRAPGHQYTHVDDRAESGQAS